MIMVPNQTNTQKYHEKFSIATRVFHWIGAALILAAIISINMGDDYISLHKSIGASFMIWTVLRVLNRFVAKTPAYLPMPKWQSVASHLTHLGLYLTMFAMPITGVLMSMYGGRGVDVFGLFSIPVLVSPDRDMAGFFNNLHTEIVFPVLLVLIFAHIAAALYHQFIVKDNLMTRMK